MDTYMRASAICAFRCATDQFQILPAARAVFAGEVRNAAIRVVWISGSDPSNKK